MRQIVVILAGAVLAGCAAAPLSEAQLAARADREARLDREEAALLDGLVAGEPVACISLTQARTSQFIGDRSIIYRVGANRLYKNDPPGGCTGLRPGTAIVTRTPGTQLCRGEYVRVVDIPPGIDVGGCTLGDFTPYTAAE